MNCCRTDYGQGSVRDGFVDRSRLLLESIGRRVAPPVAGAVAGLVQEMAPATPRATRPETLPELQQKQTPEFIPRIMLRLGVSCSLPQSTSQELWLFQREQEERRASCWHW